MVEEAILLHTSRVHIGFKDAGIGFQVQGVGWRVVSGGSRYRNNTALGTKC